jgi:hypothetical protein
MRVALPQWALALSLVALQTMVSLAAVIETTIKYIGQGTVYVGAGSSQGVQKGDSAEVWRDDQIMARLEVVYVAPSSSSARVILNEGELRIGDRVLLLITGSAAQDSTAKEAIISGTSVPGAAVSEYPAETPGRGPKTRIRGMVAAQVSHQDDREAANNDVTRPALVLRSTVENLLVNHLNLSVNLRARQIIRRSADSPSTQSDWDNRIYEVSLQYDDPASALNFQLGRIASNRISGIGIFEGALVEYGIQGGWRAGVFGGTRPDMTTSEPNPEETTAGLYAAYEAGSWTGHQVRGTFALAGRYHAGEIDEEFIYEQVYYGFSRQFFITQSAEIAINRGWREEAEGSAWGLSNVLLNVSYSPSSILTFDLGYDNRRQMRTYETQDTPDSLFDDALRQGFRAGVGARLPFGLRAYLRGGLRTRENGETDTRTLAAGLSRHNMFDSGISGTMRFNLFENRLSSGYQASLGLARYMLRVIYLQLEAGSSHYDISSGEEPVNYHWFHGAASANFTRHLYTSLYGETYRGDAMNVNRFGVEMGYRF